MAKLIDSVEQTILGYEKSLEKMRIQLQGDDAVQVEQERRVNDLDAKRISLTTATATTRDMWCSSPTPPAGLPLDALPLAVSSTTFTTTTGVQASKTACHQHHLQAYPSLPPPCSQFHNLHNHDRFTTLQLVLHRNNN